MTSIHPAAAAGERRPIFPLNNRDRYITDVILKRGLHLVGWPFPSVAPLPTLPYDFGSLRVLLAALQNGTCYYRRLTPNEIADFRQRYREIMPTQPAQEGPADAINVEPMPDNPIETVKDFQLNPTADESGTSLKRRRTE